MSKPKISIVSPVYQAEKIIPTLVDRITSNVRKITDDYEIILVEDGSRDGSWEAIEQAAQDYPNVRGFQLSRNFGQHYAITAGLDQVSGDWIIVMDCDLQDNPDEFVNLYNKAMEGYDYVLASRHFRNDGFFKKLFSRLFYSVLGYLSGVKQDNTVANFGIYNQKVINAVNRMRESIRYFPTMVKWVGFKGVKQEVDHGKRFEGKSTYNFRRLLKLAFDIILAYSDKALDLVVRLGFLISVSSGLVSIFYLVKWLRGGIDVSGFTSLIISIWFLSGIIIVTIGVVGRYVGKIFEGTRNRPIYLIRNRTDD